MNRRSFFRAFGLAPVLVPAAIVSAAEDAEQDLVPTGRYILAFHDDLNSEPNRSASVGLGKDGHLWIKTSTENKWKRIATEKILT